MAKWSITEDGTAVWEFDNDGRGGRRILSAIGLSKYGSFERIVAEHNALDGLDPDKLAEVLAIVDRIKRWNAAWKSEGGFGGNYSSDDFYDMADELSSALAALRAQAGGKP